MSHETDHTEEIRHPNTVLTGCDPSSTISLMPRYVDMYGRFTLQDGFNIMFSGDSGFINDKYSTFINTAQFILLIKSINENKIPRKTDQDKMFYIQAP